MSQTSYIPKRAMVIVAHPDDAEFTCAGTVARWAQAGTEVAYVLTTSGDVGIAEPGMTKEKAIEIREAEQRAAAKIVGVADVTFLRIPDGMVENTMDLRKRLVREIRRFRPEVVIAGDPTVVFWQFGDIQRINHPDHRATAGAAIDAVFPASGQPNLFQELETEGLKAHKVRKVYVSGHGQNGTYVDISQTVELKVQALQAHDSQLGHWADLPERVKEWTARTGAGREMAHAESFRVVTLESDEHWEKLQQVNHE